MDLGAASWTRLRGWPTILLGQATVLTDRPRAETEGVENALPAQDAVRGCRSGDVGFGLIVQGREFTE